MKKLDIMKRIIQKSQDNSSRNSLKLYAICSTTYLVTLRVGYDSVLFIASTIRWCDNTFSHPALFLELGGAFLRADTIAVCL